MNRLLETKQAVIKAGRTMFSSGLVVGTWGNLSARVPDTDTFVITPSGRNYLDLKPDDLVVMDLDGQVVSGTLKPSSEFHLHLLLYRARTEVGSVVHTHSMYASAHAVARRTIPVNVEDLAMIVGGEVRVAPYALAGTEELAENAVKSMQDSWAVLLANHGVVGVGRDIEEAMLVCQIVEKSAKINLAAQALGQAYVIDNAHVKTLRDKYLFHYGQK
ncbi:MAG TPA: class II aldolase/adducin family protein [Desulfobacteria bacterium]|nr:class II aldolase/adducin family protein [Desulfobacteria bacterium]